MGSITLDCGSIVYRSVKRCYLKIYWVCMPLSDLQFELWSLSILLFLNKLPFQLIYLNFDPNEYSLLCLQFWEVVSDEHGINREGEYYELFPPQVKRISVYYNETQGRNFYNKFERYSFVLMSDIS